MSRIGKKPISVPANVKVGIRGREVCVEGPEGKLSYTHRPEVTVEYDHAANRITVLPVDDTSATRAFHGLTRALVANMVEGVTSGYAKTLEIYGIGYGVRQEGGSLALKLGYANVVNLAIPSGVTVQIKTPQSRSDVVPAVLSVTGPDKQVVGEFAARIRHAKKTEPYKGKGIRFKGEHIRRKVGKAFGSAAK